MNKNLIRLALEWILMDLARLKSYTTSHQEFNRVVIRKKGLSGACPPAFYGHFHVAALSAIRIRRQMACQAFRQHIPRFLLISMLYPLGRIVQERGATRQKMSA